MSSPSDSKPALGDGEQQPHLPLDAPPSLPAPPPPPACSVPTSSSASATASFFNPWPFNDPSVLLFLDPFSPEAQELKKTLEITSLAFGHTFPSTLLAVEASHIVLDPSYSDANVFFRHGFPQKCVSMMWLRESFIKASPRAEEEYRLPSVDDVEEESTSEQHLPSDYVNPEYASRGGWLKSEERALAHFIASDPQPDANGASVWEQYQKDHPSRTVRAYGTHYKKRKQALDAMIAELRRAANGSPIVSEHPRVEQVEEEEEEEFVPFVKTRSHQNRGNRSSYRDGGSDESSQDEEEQSDASSEDCDGPSLQPYHRSKGSSSSVSKSSTPAWNPEDRKNFLLLLAKSPGAMFKEVMGKFRKTHPRYSHTAISTHYQRHRKAYERAVKAINSGRSNASVDSLVPVSGRTSSVKWAEDEERDLVVMLAHRKGNKREVFDAFEDKYPRRSASSINAYYQHNSKRIVGEIEAIHRQERQQSKAAVVSESEEFGGRLHEGRLGFGRRRPEQSI